MKIVKGDLFESKAQCLVNAVNCVGVMGAGIAKQFKRRFPKAYFTEYAQLCRRGGLYPGGVHLYELGDGKFIANFATKNHWQRPAQMGWIEEGLVNLKQLAIEHNIKSIAMPAIGCGLGGLDFGDVSKMVKAEFQNAPISVEMRLL